MLALTVILGGVTQAFGHHRYTFHPSEGAGEVT